MHEDKEQEKSHSIAAKTDEDQDSTLECTFSKYLLLIELSFVIFLNFASFSVMATFFPIEAARLGASKAEIGFIFGMYPLVAFPASLVYGILIPKIGAERLLLLGIFTNGITVIMFSFANLVTSRNLFVFVCITLRILAAIGGAACETTIRAIVLMEMSSNLGFSMGVLSMATEFGFTIGPVMGGALYTFGGFKLPFLVVGSILLFLQFIICFALPRKDVISKSTSIRMLFRACSIPGVSMMAVVIVVLIADLSVVDPTLAPHVHNIDPNISAGIIGLIFLLNGSVVAVMSPLAGWICDKTGCLEVLIVCGLIVGGVSLELIGPAPFLTSIFPPRKVWLVCVAMAINGGSAALTIPPSVTIMSIYARDSGLPDNLATNGVISGIITAAHNLGSFSGPVIGGIISEAIGFEWTAALFGITSFIQALFTTLFTYFWRASNYNDSADGNDCNGGELKELKELQ